MPIPLASTKPTKAPHAPPPAASASTSFQASSPSPNHSPSSASPRPLTSQHTSSTNDYSLGTVVHAVNEIVHVQGLYSASAGSLVRFTRSGSAAPALGLVMAVQTDRVIIALLNEGYQHSIVTVGDRVSHTRGDVPKFPVGPAVLGRMLSPLGVPCDQQPPLSSSLPYLPTLSPSSPSLTNRASPTHFVSTGVKHLDFFHPLTRGLRIGLLGDKSTGKTTLALDALTFLIQQSRAQPNADQRVYGVYVCAGKKANEMNRVRERLLRAGVLDSCVVVCSSDSDSMGSQYLAPFSGCTVADWLRDEGKHVVIVYDDLVTHGAVCTGIDRSLGYPALSTSYLHARLLERTAAINGGGSSTAICILESLRPDRVASVIESLVGFVDHCVYLDAHMASDGYWPAINCSSIIGRPSARFRSPLTRGITNLLSQTMLQSERTANQYAWAKEFGLEDDDEDADVLQYRDKLQVLLSQHQAMRLEDQTLSLLAATRNQLAGVAFEDVEEFEMALHASMRADHAELYEQLRAVCSADGAQKEFPGTLRARLEEAVQQFIEQWRRQHAREEQ